MAYLGNPANLNDVVASTEMSNLKKALIGQSTFNSSQKWEQVAMITALGGSGPVNNAYCNCTFDGRYMYFAATDSQTLIRYDTTASFNVAASWQQIAVTSAIGITTYPGGSPFLSCTFDGRYVYFAPYGSTTFVRYDSTQAFNASNSWGQVAMQTAQGNAAVASAYEGCTFDGRYVYFTATFSATFVRYDTTASFTAAGSWQQMPMSSAQSSAGVSGYDYVGCTFDGRYVYYAPSVADFFIRFDTTQTFNAMGSWQQVLMQTAFNGAASINYAYFGCTFDGRYIYFAPFYSATFIRYDTTAALTAAASWQRIPVNSATGGDATTVGAAYQGCTFDGRYVYFTATYSDTFVRYDTTQAFDAISSWGQVSMSVAQNAATVDAAYRGCGFDGKYVYMCAADSDTLIRFLANSADTSGPTEFAQVSS